MIAQEEHDVVKGLVVAQGSEEISPAPMRGQGRITPLPTPPAKIWLWWNCGERSSLGFTSWAFCRQYARFYSGGTRIRTGGTMIFSRHAYVLTRSMASAKSALLQGFSGLAKDALSAAY
jgi:hypothetical protein